MKGLRYLLLAWVILVAGMALLRYVESPPEGSVQAPAPT